MSERQEVRPDGIRYEISDELTPEQVDQRVIRLLAALARLALQKGDKTK